MKITAVIAEYNPFHNGHAYHLQKVKESSDCVVIVMSGHLVQRAELASYDKWTRTKAALLGGGDLVIELPALFSYASAERFAHGAICLLNRLDCVQTVSFGSEAGNLRLLENLAEDCIHLHQSQSMQNLLKQGYSYPAARQRALGEKGNVLSLPNNTLGIEYIKAAKKMHASLSFHTVARIGAMHDAEQTGKFSSSSYLRAHPSEMPKAIPPSILPFFLSESSCQSNNNRLELPTMVRLRQLSKENFLELPDVTEGLENRLFRAAQEAQTLEEFLSLAKTKRYTHSRLRRIALSALLGVQKQEMNQSPRYARVLGFNNLGRQALRRMQQKSTLLITPDFPTIYRKYPTLAKWDKLATDLFFLTTKQRRPCGEDFRRSPIQMRNFS